MRRTSRRTADPRPAVVLGLIALLATGCVTMPAGGPPEPVEMPQGAADSLQVHVYPVAPHPGESPTELLTGFLDSSNADQANYDTARQYLTAEAGKRWKPETGVDVLSAAPLVPVTVPQQGAVSVEITVSGDRVAELDPQHSYRAVTSEAYQKTFAFVKETEGPNKGEWRIDRLPDGVIVDQTNFKNGYKAVHRYFFARTDPTADRSSSAPVLVPDPIYLRRRIDPLTAAAVATAAGPSAWLTGAVDNPFDGVRVQSVTVSDNRVATVRVDGTDLAGRSPQCALMAEQLYHAVADQQGKAQLDRLDLSGSKGGCSVGSGQAGQVAPGALAGGAAGSQPYFQLDDGRLMRYQEEQSNPVPGLLGQVQQPKAGVVAVRRDGGSAAQVSLDGRNLYVVPLRDSGKLGDPVTQSKAPRPDSGLASPSWDGHGDLWVVDRDPGAAANVLMVRDRAVTHVQVDGPRGVSVQALRIASDGTRIALVVRGADGRQSVQLGLVVHEGTAAAPKVRITALRPVAAQLTEIASVSWADTDQLLVLGKETNKLQQLLYVGTDGSQGSDTALQGGEWTAVSTTEARGAGEQLAPPVLTVSDHRIWRLQDSQWREVAPKQQAIAFAYPG